MSMDNLICVSYNVKGLSSPIKRKKIFNQLRKMHCSIALLQETHLSDGEHLKLRREWVDQVYSASYNKGKRRGVAIMFAKSVFYLEQLQAIKSLFLIFSHLTRTIHNFSRMFSLFWHRKVRECI